MTILVTGGAGFIGSNFVRRWFETHDEEVVILDAFTYAGFPGNLAPLFYKNRLDIFKGDIGDKQLVDHILYEYQPHTIYHFAAESHVDNSIANPLAFIKTNILGTVNLLECVRRRDPRIRFIHVSTDEVYGSLKLEDEPFNESTQYDPRSPYSASKASSDHFINAYRNTYGLEAVITNCSNNYGPNQHPEKFIPTVILAAMQNKPIPIYGTGLNMRDWLYVDDHCDALLAIRERGDAKKYCIGGGTQLDNLTLAKKILDLLGKPYDLLKFVEDRKGHDFRYDIDNEKVWLDTGWKPAVDFETGLRKTVEWYVNNPEWVKSCQERSVLFSQVGNQHDCIPPRLQRPNKFSQSTTSLSYTIPSRL